MHHCMEFLLRRHLVHCRGGGGREKDERGEMKPKGQQFQKEIVAGGGAGILGLSASYVFDTVKVNQQIFGGSMAATFVNIWKANGLKGFFRGMLVPVLANGFIFSVFFTSYAGLLEWLAQRDGKRAKYPYGDVEDISSFQNVFIAGCVGGVMQSFAVGPAELIKVQMQISSRVSAVSSLKTIKYITALRGYRGLSIGLGATLARDIHSHGVYTVAYKYYLDNHCGSPITEEMLKTGVDPGGQSSLCWFTAGGIAGVLFWWSCLPLDVIKSQIQADSISKPKYKGMWDCGRKIYRAGGVRGFFRGTLALSARAFISNGIIFVTYEKIRTFLDIVW